MAARLTEIQSWMSLSAEALAHWTALTGGFIEWVAYTVLLGEGMRHARVPPVAAAAAPAVTIARFENTFPLVWQQYVEQVGADDTLV